MADRREHVGVEERAMITVPRDHIRDHNSHVVRVSISDAKHTLRSLIDRAKAGDAIVILDRGIPVARLVSDEGDAASGATDSGRTARLIRTGVISPPRASSQRRDEILAALCDVPRGQGRSTVDILIEERREGR